MKLVKKMSKQLAAFLLAMMMAASQTVMAEEIGQQSKNQVTAESTTKSAAVDDKESKEVRLQDDFYAAVNKEWLASAKLKPGYTSYDTFTEVSDKCEEQLQALFSEILSKEDQYASTSTEKKMINLYNNYLNKEERNKQGTEPIKPYLEKIKAVKSLDDVHALFSDMLNGNIASIYTLGISGDLKDSNRKAFYVGSTGLLLGDADYYNKPSADSKVIEQATTNYLNKLLVLMGYSKDEAKKKVEDAYAFEKLLTPSMIGKEERTKTSNIYEKMYNLYTLDELDNLAPNLKLKSKIQGIVGNKVDKVVVSEPDWLKALNKVYTEDNLDSIKNYMEIKYLCSTVGCLSEDFEKIADEYNAELTGVEGTLPDEQEAMQTVSGFFSDEIGKLYVEKYFSKEAKADVQDLVKEIISVYKKKIQAVDWMTDETKANAIKKLDAMVIKIGYPDKWEDYSNLEIKSYAEGGSLLENSMNLSKRAYKKMIDEVNKPVDKTEFIMSPQVVNACYNPSANDITFPAAILQAPFYDVNRSKEENLGSIGAVIAHEISHAFDNNGANFDEKGNVKQWWTKEDYAKFEEKAQVIRSFYNNVKTDSGDKVNGDLTVGENIADITAMSCMLDIMKDMKDPNYKAFFESWAKTWKMIATDEFTKYALQVDVHSPNKVRTNNVVQQFQEFYDTYDVKEGDGMYVKPEDRLRVY